MRQLDLAEVFAVVEAHAPSIALMAGLRRRASDCRSAQDARPRVAAQAAMDVPSPAVDPGVERLGTANRLARTAAILTHDVEERRAPFVIGQKAVDIAADRS